MRINVQINVFASERAEGDPHMLICVCSFVVLCFRFLMSLGEASPWIRVHSDMQHINDNDNTEQVQK